MATSICDKPKIKKLQQQVAELQRQVKEINDRLDSERSERFDGYPGYD